MALARVKTWAAETLYFADLNAEFNNILNNPGSLITPVTFNLTFTDATYDIGASGATRPRDFFLSRNATIGGTLTAAGNVGIASLGKIYLDGVALTGDTYIHESAANVMKHVVGGADALQLTATAATFVGTTSATAATHAWVQKAIAYTGADTTPSVLNASFMTLTNGGGVTITNFDDGVTNQVITLFFNDSNTTVNRDNCALAGGANFTGTANDTLTLMKSATIWVEIARSVNA